MKIQCDVCNHNEASIYCSADEAALCSACDHRVHHANKLAGKHPRFSLLHPSPKQKNSPPICDICQDQKAFLFCQQDRAILCKDCDVGIHKLNQHTQNHNRFLLTGVKLSTNTCLAENDVVHDQQVTSLHQQTTNELSMGHGSTSSSSLSKYLIETIPGWHVEDFLDPPLQFNKDPDQLILSGNDMLHESLNSYVSFEPMGIWVPQAPQPFESRPNMGFGDQIVNGSTLSFAQNSCSKIRHGTKSSRKWRSDTDTVNCFTVPQISPPSSERSKTLWH
ncbi:hypothetical protein QVD17_01656 [Tagetes erecta]|uniref:B box-type domain-containing protein n=1 Tax=Tagetes erecta TaxID=13708 RepID=A0AAD8L594_TARER|nr:hypothetical protein QVD17_01656 [Tagetes erecta]